MNILLTNDDGIQAVGLRALYRSMKNAGLNVQVVAPVTEQSAVGHAVSLSSPLRVKMFEEEGFSGFGVYGTPVDCVKLGLTTLLDVKPDIVISGINNGANTGVDILYSGTVSAATEGALMGISALAVSYDSFNPTDLTEQADCCVEMLNKIPWSKLAEKTVLNLNFPALTMADTRKIQFCRHTRVSWQDWYDVRKDPRGHPYYWLAGIMPKENISPGTDRDLLTKGHITMTPLHFDFTDREAIVTLEQSFDI
ncbi:5'-nucleotidase /3'-nucleotidase /exopolyphosphatase [Maridesulfovibrio ferrireducens]|uniref:5'-nucleotidase SurE n=1 Tax=Maridesulfovibrio ferrireducens TaxID=246191 RepID=A0A1G9I830_9BACT|nr:5'/3'-nucleotidase SurE [Maridesulfovibrio ferrireducens]SDL21430.1 5'-nucleotidase /3'-nucleotidase /exopolyphosphatase [Maridesulfovibrio ferrireducens]